MKIRSVGIQNFKLMRDVKLDFSLDPAHPLTVIRAENGNGKTTLLHALSWALYGDKGLPAEARNMRLLDSSTEVGKPERVQVRIDFENKDSQGLTVRYRLIRTLEQTLTGPDPQDVKDGPGSVLLYRITDSGEDEVEVSLIRKLFPERLLRVFFTDGDGVQAFISGSEAAVTRQKEVHNAINALLGLDELRAAAANIKEVASSKRRDAAAAAGGSRKAAEEVLAARETEEREAGERLAECEERLANMTVQKSAWNKELDELRGKGDLDEIQARLATVRAELTVLDAEQKSVLKDIRTLFESETFSWKAMEPVLLQGLTCFETLVDQGVVPGISIEVLRDRVNDGVCICGESLAEHPAEASVRRNHVISVIEENLSRSLESQALTELWHRARTSWDNESARRVEESPENFDDRRQALMDRYTGKTDQIRAKRAEESELDQQRTAIDEVRVDRLRNQIDGVEKKINDANSERGGLKVYFDAAVLARESARAAFEKAEKEAGKSERAELERLIAEDLHEVASSALKAMETEYVSKVAEKTSQMFLYIVGADPEYEAGVFTGVTINDNFDIKVNSRDASLDPAFELNGASKRALTLSFIWSLMEVAGSQEPRVIDTPLGMIAGGVRERMVKAITSPNNLDSQTVLLLTRSEIRDIEDLLTERAGEYWTLTCSKDVKDLVHPWGADRAEVRVCGCTHRQSCELCARKYDAQHGVMFQTRGDI